MTIKGDRLTKFNPDHNPNDDLTVTIPKRFRDLDQSGDGALDYNEFCTGFGFEKSPLVKKLFEAFDSDNGGQIDLAEFISGLNNWKNFSFGDKVDSITRALSMSPRPVIPSSLNP